MYLYLFCALVVCPDSLAAAAAAAAAATAAKQSKAKQKQKQNVGYIYICSGVQLFAQDCIAVPGAQAH